VPVRSGPPLPPRVLVIGLGFIGERFARTLNGRGVETVVLTRSAPEPWQLEGLSLAELVIADAADPDALEHALTGVEHVVHAAGGLMPAQSDANPGRDAALSFPPVISVLEALRVRPGVSLTFISSGGTVYGQPHYFPVDERHPTEPISAYGVVKLASEKFVSMYATLHAVTARILRCSNVYGENQPATRNQGIVATFVDRLLTGSPAVLYGDGSIVRDFVYVQDVVDAALALVGRNPEPLILNVAGGRGHSLNEVITLIEAAGKRSLALERLPARPFDVSEIVLDVSRLRALVDFEPTSFEAGIAKVLAAERSIKTPAVASKSAG
jgi:UDP-glucose 4-epimerase